MKQESKLWILMGMSVLIAQPSSFAASASSAGDPIAKLVCSNLDLSKVDPKVRNGIVLDPLYYRDAMKGLRVAGDALRKILADQKNFKSQPIMSSSGNNSVVDQTRFQISTGDGDNTLKSLKTSLAPTLLQYHQLDAYLTDLANCFQKDCRLKDDRDGTPYIHPANSIPKVEATLNKLIAVYDDMDKKLQALQACDPYVQTKKDSQFFTELNRIKAKLLKANRTLADLKAKELACRAPSSKTMPENTDISSLAKALKDGTSTPTVIMQTNGPDAVAAPVPSSLDIDTHDEEEVGGEAQTKGNATIPGGKQEPKGGDIP